MTTPTTVKAPVHFAHTCIREAVGHLARQDSETDTLTRLDAVIRETGIAIPRTGDAFTPASLVLTTARHGAITAKHALMQGNTDEALGAARATLSILSNVPAIIEAPVEDDEGRA